jgi:ATP-dependent DNA helicase RecG
LREAHKVFASNFEILREDQKAVHEYAQTKNILASKERDRYVRKRLNLEAAELLRRAIQISDDKVRTAWCWYDLARTLFWLNSPESEILNAYSKAMELLPDEPIFGLNYNKWKADSKKWGRY